MEDIIFKFGTVRSLQTSLTSYNFFDAIKLKILENYMDGDSSLKAAPFLINLETIHEALKQNLISEDVFKEKFTGVLNETSSGEMIFHVNPKCGLQKNEVSFLKEEETFQLSLKDLPTVFIECKQCCEISIPSFLVTILYDLLIINQLFDKKYVKEVAPFTPNKFFTALLSFKNLQKRFYSTFSSVVNYTGGSILFNFSSILEAEILTKLGDKADVTLNNIYASWFKNSSKDSFEALAANKSDYFNGVLVDSFDDTLILACVEFTGSYVPEIKCVLDETSTEIKYDKNNEVIRTQESKMRYFIESTLSQKHPVGKVNYNLDVILASLLNTFKVHVNVNKTKYFILIPRSLHEFLFTHVALMEKVFSKQCSFQIVSFNSVIAGDFTSDVIENFVSLWDRKNKNSFIGTWEIAKLL